MSQRRKKPLAIEDIDPMVCTVDRRLEALRHVPFLAQLPDRAIENINTLFRARGFTPDEIIYLEDDPATRLYVIAVGKVKLIRHTASGQDVALDILPPGEFFGSLTVLGDREYPDTAQAQTPCCVLEIAAEEFQSVLESYPSVSLKVLELVSTRLRDARVTIQQLSASPVEVRVAATLLRLADKLGEQSPDGLIIEVPLSRQDLAEMTGTTTESVSRVMSEFRKRGIIKSGREWVSITNTDRLREIAGDGLA